MLTVLNYSVTVEESLGFSSKMRLTAGIAVDFFFIVRLFDSQPIVIFGALADNLRSFTHQARDQIVKLFQ